MPSEYKLKNEEVVVILKEVLAALEVKDANKFRIRAYQNVISSIESSTISLFDLYKQNRLSEIPGMGTTLKSYIIELFTTGAVKDFETEKQDLPQGMFELIGIRGIGAKKAYKLSVSFNLENRETALADVEEAAKKGQIQKLEGFGKKSESDILEALSKGKKTKKEKQRTLLINAEQVSLRILKYLKSCDKVQNAIVLGSLRRRASTVGDIDIAVVTTSPNDVISHFLNYIEIEDVLAQGESKVSVVLNTDIQVDIRLIDYESLGSMMQYFTGDKQHNVLLRKYALSLGFSVNEYGITNLKNKKIHKFGNDRDFYEFLNLQFIPPEIRQGKNEVDLAQIHKLPSLVETSDIKGDLHTHTNASDGLNTLNEMVESASMRGYEYIGITDHAPSVNSRGTTNVQSIISTRGKVIEQINYSKKYSIKVLFGYEINILKDAKLAMPDNFIKQLDYGIAAIHTSFNQPREQINKRLLAAIKNPFIKIIAHPSGRLINQRDGIDADWDLIFKQVKKHDKILEINSQPNRLDLADDLVYEARRMGVYLVINTDSHDIDSLDLIKYGVDVAKRGWCEKKDIINTLGYNDLIEILKS